MDVIGNHPSSAYVNALELSATRPQSEGEIDVVDRGWSIFLRLRFVIDTCHSVLSTDCRNCIYSKNDSTIAPRALPRPGTIWPDSVDSSHQQYCQERTSLAPQNILLPDIRPLVPVPFYQQGHHFRICSPLSPSLLVS